MAVIMLLLFMQRGRIREQKSLKFGFDNIKYADNYSNE